ncbi:hypothetical protein ACIQVO_08450 [Streptomyces sp. NPDC101062]|uniref:hypothetical protein n=1 Tax=unclassified Streptomyces TaxID=2593676 RepID=UPI0038061D6F
MDQRLTTSTRTGEKPENGATGPGADPEEGERKGPRIELSLPQVAGSALAAIAAAVLASQLGVYGTIIGAGVVSVVATCGGSVFQHLFRRTGEQIRVAAVQAKPGGRQVPISPERGDPGRRDDSTGSADSGRGIDATRLMPQVPQVPRTARMPQVPQAAPGSQASPEPPESPASPSEEFTRATTHGTRVRGWKRPVLAAGIVFGVAMGGITGYELISGQDLSGGTGTTVGSVVSGGHRTTPSTPTDPSATPSPDTTTSTGGDTGTTPEGGTSPSLSGSGRSDGTDQESGTGSGSDTGTDPTGTPSAPASGPTDSSGSTSDSTGDSDSGASSAPAPTPSGSADTTAGGDGGTTSGE